MIVDRLRTRRVVVAVVGVRVGVGVSTEGRVVVRRAMVRMVMPTVVGVHVRRRLVADRLRTERDRVGVPPGVKVLGDEVDRHRERLKEETHRGDARQQPYAEASRHFGETPFALASN